MQDHSVCEQLKEFIMTRFPSARNRSLQPTNKLLENGILDSLGVLDLVTYIEETFHIGVSDEDLVPENFYTLERIDAFVCERRRAL